MNIFLICSVRNASEETLQSQADYVFELERQGHRVHYPPRDTQQSATGIEICRQNRRAILAADEVHVWYTPGSQGTHFDMGMAFAHGKRVRLANELPVPDGKNFIRMLAEWEQGL